MSDLEDLWNSVPTGDPPTGAILAQGRRRARHRQAVGRPLVAVGTAAALVGAFLAGTVVGGGDGTTDTPPSPQLPALSPVAFQADLAAAESCEALLATYVDRALGEVTAWGWDSPSWRWGYRDLVGTFDDRGLEAVRAAAAKAPEAQLATERVTASKTGTNVQEEQVDEPDTVKTDGDLLVRLRDDELLVYDVTGAQPRLLSTLRLAGLEDGEILLAGDTVVAVGADRQSSRSEDTGIRRGTRVQAISIADPDSPTVAEDVTYTAAVASVRQHGDTVRMVLSSGLPDLPFVQPRKNLPARAALARNRRVVERSTLRDWLPAYDAGAGATDLLDCRNVAVPPAAVALDTASVVTFDAQSPTAPQAFGLAGATTIAYESADALFLASTPVRWWGCLACRVADDGSASGTSYLFQFDLRDGRAVHVASGEVEGTIRDRWSLDETDGELRVLVGPSSETGNFNAVVTLARRGARLVETGRLDGIGRGEEVKSVRWQDDLALVVTFRQVDPLYVVDLRDRPRLVSELKVPGFSEYLHPLGSRRLIGVGYGPGERGWGAQLGLFRTRDLRGVTRLDVTSYGRGTDPVAGDDPRAFTWLPEHRTVLTVIRDGRTGWLSIQRLADNRLHNRMLQVEYGDDVVQVRTFGMPDGRVLLVTGEDVRFLDL